MPQQQQPAGEHGEGFLLCAWCGKELGWVGDETVYTLCRECIPIASEAIQARGQPRREATDDGEDPPVNDQRLRA